MGISLHVWNCVHIAVECTIFSLDMFATCAGTMLECANGMLDICVSAMQVSQKAGIVCSLENHKQNVSFQGFGHRQSFEGVFNGRSVQFQ